MIVLVCRLHNDTSVPLYTVVKRVYGALGALGVKTYEGTLCAQDRLICTKSKELICHSEVYLGKTI